MAETFAGRVSITPEGAGDTTIVIDGNTGNITLGGAEGADGDLTLKDLADQVRITLDGQSNKMEFFGSDGGRTLYLGPSGNVIVGGAGGDGDLELRDANGQARIAFDAQSSRIVVRDENNETLFDLNASARMTVGGAGDTDGDLVLLDAAGLGRVRLDAQHHRLQMVDADGATVVDLGPDARLILGGAGGHVGAVGVTDSSGNVRAILSGSSPHLRIMDMNGGTIAEIGMNGGFFLGGARGVDGEVFLRDSNGLDRVVIDSDSNQIELRDSANHLLGQLGEQANLRLGSGGYDGDILLYPSSAPNLEDNATATIHLDANAGDITLRNADCAEEFEIAPSVDADPGTVMALGPDGRLRPSRHAHDRAVVGVVSGGGHYRPGIVLDRQSGPGVRRPIALVGKAFVRVTDEAGPIEIGDLLTPSSIPGAAMKAVDPFQAFGAVIGKAIAGHRVGEGMIPMIIALQ